MSVPYSRLTPTDIYHYLEWVVQDWTCGERVVEIVIDGELKQRLMQGADLTRLERAVWHMPTAYRERAVPILEELKQARLDELAPLTTTAVERVAAQSWRGIIVRLRMVVSEWEAQRKRRAAEATQEDGA